MALLLPLFVVDTSTASKPVLLAMVSAPASLTTDLTTADLDQLQLVGLVRHVGVLNAPRSLQRPRFEEHIDVNSTELRHLRSKLQRSIEDSGIDRLYCDT